MAPDYLLLSAFVGAVAGWIMHGFMLAVSAHHDTPVDMVKALGSFGVGDVGPRARTLGFILHTAGGAVIGIFYGYLVALLELNDRPAIVLAGVILGFFHGLTVCFMLMMWISERHPVETYRRATIPVGLVHLTGHIVYGLLVALGLLLLS
jgi:hypothetical protein